MSEDHVESGPQKVPYTVRCYDHDGSYRHLAEQPPEKCQHCGSFNIESERSDIHRHWSDGLWDAVCSEDHTVELVGTDTGVAQVLIDGVPMFDRGGYPVESFNIANSNEYQQYVTEDGLQKLRELFKERECDGE